MGGLGADGLGLVHRPPSVGLDHRGITVADAQPGPADPARVVQQEHAWCRRGGRPEPHEDDGSSGPLPQPVDGRGELVEVGGAGGTRLGVGHEDDRGGRRVVQRDGSGTIDSRERKPGHNRRHNAAHAPRVDARSRLGKGGLATDSVVSGSTAARRTPVPAATGTVSPMSVSVALEELRDEIGRQAPVCFLLTVGPDGRPHSVQLAVSWADPGQLAFHPGNKTVANAQDRPLVSLLWPPRELGGYSLIVDATVVTASGSGDGANSVLVRPTRAVLHRPARPDNPEAVAHGSDCVRVFSDSSDP